MPTPSVVRGAALMLAAVVVTGCGTDAGADAAAPRRATAPAPSPSPWAPRSGTSPSRRSPPGSSRSAGRTPRRRWRSACSRSGRATGWPSGGDGLGEWVEAGYDEAPELIETLEPSYEAIAALEPDLILDTRSAATEERHDLLSAIAPTISQPEGVGPYQTTWQQQLEMVGQALGKDEEAGALAAEVEQAFADAAAEHPEFDGTEVAVGAYTSEGFGAYVRGDSRVAFMEQLGFQNKAAVQERRHRELLRAGRRGGAPAARRRADRRLPDLRRGLGVHLGPAVAEPARRAGRPCRRARRRNGAQRVLQRLGPGSAVRPRGRRSRCSRTPLLPD